MNELADVAVPPGVVTEIVPLVAPLGTVVEMWLASVTEKVAVVPLNFTPVAPVKFVPVSVTLVPTCPLAGEKLVIVGAATLTVKVPVEVAVPCGVTIEIFPVTAPLGTTADTLVALTTENVAAAPPIVTEVAPAKFVPLTLTEVPALPLVGAKLLIAGVAAGCGGVVAVVLPPPQPICTPVQASAEQISTRRIPREIFLLILDSALRQPKNIGPCLTAVTLTPWTRIALTVNAYTCPKGQFSSSRIVSWN